MIIQVVEKSSATFEYSDCKNMPFQRNHKNLNKFVDRDTDYRKVLNAITTCIERTGNFTISEQVIEGWMSSYHEK